MMEAETITMRIVSVKKAKRAISLFLGTFWPLIFTGRTALGWMICLKLLRTIFSSITPRIHLKPPLVLPAQAPKYITSPSITQVKCGH